MVCWLNCHSAWVQLFALHVSSSFDSLPLRLKCKGFNHPSICRNAVGYKQVITSISMDILHHHTSSIHISSYISLVDVQAKLRCSFLSQVRQTHHQSQPLDDSATHHDLNELHRVATVTVGLTSQRWTDHHTKWSQRWSLRLLVLHHEQQEYAWIMLSLDSRCFHKTNDTAGETKELHIDQCPGMNSDSAHRTP